MGGILECIFLKELSKRFLAKLIAILFCLRVTGFKDKLLVCKNAGHKNKGADSFFDSGKNTANMRIEAVTDVGEPFWIDIVSGGKEIDTATKVDHLLARNFCVLRFRL